MELGDGGMIMAAIALAMGLVKIVERLTDAMIKRKNGGSNDAKVCMLLERLIDRIGEMVDLQKDTRRDNKSLAAGIERLERRGD